MAKAIMYLDDVYGTPKTLMLDNIEIPDVVEASLICEPMKPPMLNILVSCKSFKTFSQAEDGSMELESDEEIDTPTFD